MFQPSDVLALVISQDEDDVRSSGHSQSGQQQNCEKKIHPAVLGYRGQS